MDAVGMIARHRPGVRSAGHRGWQETRRWRRALLVVFVVLAPMWVVSSPAAADPEDCVRRSEDMSVSGSTPGSKYVLMANDVDYFQCQEPLDDHTCWQLPTTMDVILVNGDQFCTVGGEEFIPCRNDIRFSMAGYEDPSRAFLAGDHEGAAIVPHGVPAWWLDEVERETGADRGQGCRLASDPPTHRPCTEIREERNDLRDEVETLEAEGTDPSRLRTARDELNDLEHLGSIVPDPCWGQYANRAYTLTYDASEDGFTDPSRLLFWLAQLIFSLLKTVLSVALWVVNLALVFDVSQFRTTVADFAGRIDRNLVHLGVAELSLFDLAWFALFAWAGFQAVKGRAGRAGAEIVVALVLASLGVVMVGNFFPASDDGGFRSSVDGGEAAYVEGGYFDSVSELVNLSALGLLRVGTGDDLNVGGEDMADDRVEELLVPFNEKIHREFIERPYLFIQYGTDEFDADVSIDGEAGSLTCSQVKLALLTMENPDGRWVRGFLEDNGCTEAANRNGTMSVQRLMDTALVVVVALILGGVLVLAGGTLLMAKFVTAVLFVALPLAVVVALLPGAGRSLAWGWLTTLLQMWLAALATGASLAFLLLGLDAVLATTQDRDLAERWLIVLVLMMGVALVRRRLLAGARSMSRGLQQKLAGVTAGPGGPPPSWGAQHGRPPMNDVDLFDVDRTQSRVGIAGRVAGGLAAHATARVATRAGRSAQWTAGSPVRTQMARWNRYQNAKLSAKYHWSNGVVSKGVTDARNVLQGKELDRNGAIKEVTRDRKRAELAQTHGHALGSTRGEARRIDAALAYRDVETLKGQQVNKPSGRLSPEARAAGQRLGLTDAELDQWHTGKNRKTKRKQLIRRAERRRDAVELDAGGRQTGRTMERAARLAEAVRNERLGAVRTTQQGNRYPAPPRQESYQDRKKLRDRAAADGVAEDSGRQRVRQIRADADLRLEGAGRRFTRDGARRYLGGEE